MRCATLTLLVCAAACPAAADTIRLQHVETIEDHVEAIEPVNFARVGDGDGRPLLSLPPVGVVLQLVRRDHHRAVVLVPGVQGSLVAEVPVAKLKPARAGSAARPLADALPAPALLDAAGQPLPRLTIGELLARSTLPVGRIREAVVVYDSAAGTRPLFQLAPRRVLAVLGYTEAGAAYVYSGGATGYVPGGAPALAWPTAWPRVTRDLPAARQGLGVPWRDLSLRDRAGRELATIRQSAVITVLEQSWDRLHVKAWGDSGALEGYVASERVTTYGPGAELPGDVMAPPLHGDWRAAPAAGLSGARPASTAGIAQRLSGARAAAPLGSTGTLGELPGVTVALQRGFELERHDGRVVLEFPAGAEASVLGRDVADSKRLYVVIAGRVAGFVSEYMVEDDR